MNNDRMPSVLHICTDFWPSTGGIERFVLDLAIRSESIGIKVAILCLNRTKSQRTKLPRSAVISGIGVTRISFVDMKFYKPALPSLSFLRQYDILHVHGVGALLDFVVLTKSLHRKRIILSTHGGLFHTNTLLPIKRLYFFGLQRIMLRYVDAVAACSKTDAALFKRISRRVVLIENAVETSTYLALRRHEQQGRCLYVGRLSDNKGVPNLLKAFAAAKQQGAKFELRLVGRDENDNRERYVQLAKELGILDWVVFVGEVSQQGLLHEYQCAQIFVSASHYEGFGLSAIEAKAAGCRLVLNKNIAFTDIFSSDTTATLADFTISKSAGSALSSALRVVTSVTDSERREVEAYSWQRKLEEWQSLYQKYI